MTTSDTGPLTTTGSLGKRAGRPRSAQSHQAILDATVELLAEEGFQTMTIEGVAARAEVGKATIYRRWSSKDELVMEALSQLQTDIVPIIDTRNVRNDLIMMLRNSTVSLTRYPLIEKLLFKLIGEAKTHPAILQVLLDRLSAPRLQALSQIIADAQARGEIRQDLDTFLVVSLVAGPLLYRLLLSGLIAPPVENMAEQIVEAVLYGIKAR